jgi:hypothetical protein
MALLTGNAVVEEAKEIYKREVKTVATGAITLDKTPVGDPVGVFVLNADGSNGTELTKGTPGTNEDEFSISSKTVTVHTSLNTKNIVVYYKLNSGSSSKTIRVSADSFGGTFKLIMDVLVTDYATKALYPAQLTVFNCKIQDDWSLDFKPDSDPSVLNIPIEVLRNPTNQDMWTLTIYSEDELV